MQFQMEIEIASEKHAVDAKWIEAVIIQESNWNQYALRYEPAFSYFEKPDEFARKLGITLNTEIQAQKMSWGLGQIMGGLARQYGHEGPMGMLFEPKINIDLMAAILKKLSWHSNDPKSTFSMYNGGIGAYFEFQKTGKYPNQSYVDSVMKHLQDIEKGAL